MISIPCSDPKVETLHCSALHLLCTYIVVDTPHPHSSVLTLTFYILLHIIASHYIPLHCITLQSVTLPQTTLHDITLHCIALLCEWSEDSRLEGDPSQILNQLSP